MPSLNYYRRIFSAYLLGGKSHLTFWHETPAENPNASTRDLGEYYMLFSEKADYKGVYDSHGVPATRLSRQDWPPIQPHRSRAVRPGKLQSLSPHHRSRTPAQILSRRRLALAHLEQNAHGLSVWNHHFNWEYRDTLRAPWYSALAQGQGISVLVRAHKESRKEKYLDAAKRALASFYYDVQEGGVAFTDESGDLWFEEYIVSPPTHILNGFIWASWGVYDYFLATQHPSAQDLFSRAVRTMLHNLDRYDLGFWSLYEQSGTRLPMVASPFYHRLHIVQLRIMHRLTGEQKFAQVADRWDNYTRSRANRARAVCYKSAFKLCYY